MHEIKCVVGYVNVGLGSSSCVLVHILDLVLYIFSACFFPKLFSLSKYRFESFTSLCFLVSGFMIKEGMFIVEGVWGVLRSDFTKNQDIRNKKKLQNKKKSDRPTLCKSCYVTLNTYFFLA